MHVTQFFLLLLPRNGTDFATKLNDTLLTFPKCDCWFNIECVVKTRVTCARLKFDALKWQKFSGFPVRMWVRAYACVLYFNWCAPRIYFFVIFITSFVHKHDIVVSQVTHSPHLHVIIFLQIYDKRYVIVLMKCEAGVQMPKLDESHSLFVKTQFEQHVSPEARHFLLNQHSAGKSSAQHRFKRKRNNQICKNETSFPRTNTDVFWVWFESMFPQTIVNFFLL